MADYILLNTITKDTVGTKVNFRGKIEFVKQTGGPTLMKIHDGTAQFTLKAFVKPGVRAFPEIEIGDFSKVFATITERQGSIEAEVISMNKLTDAESAEMQAEMVKIKLEQAKPLRTDFSIDSPVLVSMKARFINVATIIRAAFFEGRPIILRHDADCDGYSSANMIENGILGLMNEMSGGDVMLQYQNYKRAPSKAPFYEYEDALKDMAFWLRDKVKNGAKSPLVIITDNGSTSEDILGYKQVGLYDCDVVVIDHHYPGEKDESGKVAVDYFVQGHINPYLEGHDSNVCSGMLGYELSRFIYEKCENSVMIPAMASILDHVDGPEKDEYIRIANEQGFDTEYMTKLGEIIYLQSHYIRFGEYREFVQDLMTPKSKVQQSIVDMLYPEVEKLYAKTRQIGKAYSKVTDYGKFYVVEFDGEKGTSRGQFPAVGKSTNLIHAMHEEELDKPVVTMTNGSTFLTIRVGDDIKGFSVPFFCTEWIDKKIPHTGAEGGGHEHAGSVKFVEYAREEVINLFKDYLKEINDKQ
jgi:RecJ-like exonuclease